MRWFGISMLVIGLTACGRCGGGEGTTELPAMAGDGSMAGVDVPMPGAVYKEAYERARNQVSADNARDRLDELEHDIDREAESMH